MEENTANAGTTRDEEAKVDESPKDEGESAEGQTPKTDEETEGEAEKKDDEETEGEAEKKDDDGENTIDIEATDDTETIADSEAESMSISTQDEEEELSDGNESKSSEAEFDMSFAQTSTIATLLPDEILNFCRVHGKERRRFECVLLLADISGFTALCERYTLSGKGGTYYMTKTLNSYLGKMVQEIIVNGGDVLKFSGDAFLACWKVFEGDRMAATITKIVKCALLIQKTLGEYETDVHVSLKVKLAISAGTATFSVIGDEDTRHYIIVGEPITDIRLAEYLCVSGDVLLSPSAWKFCDSEKYAFSPVGEYGHIKITKEILAEDDVPPPPKKESKKKKSGEMSDWESSRYIVVRSGQNKDGPYLRPFIITPVLRQVDHEEPLEYLTEMRQITTMFVNVITADVPVDQFISLVDEAYYTVCRNTEKFSGCVNKVSLFDKDLMFLVIFGLRGSSHDMETQNGLICAAYCHQQLKLLIGVKGVSIGVTTGMAYCGVVGHPMRREYTVLGSTVNKAARIMVAYQGKISCDRSTFIQSKLSAAAFVLQESKELKGLSMVGPVYEFFYTEKRAVTDVEVTPWPVLGRDTAIKLFYSKYVSLLVHKKMKDKKLKHTILHSGIVFYGEPRVGKTRLLKDLANLIRAQDNPCLLASFTSAHRRAPYAAAAYFFQLIIGIDDLANAKEKEEVISSYFGLELKPNELCYLNDIFQIKLTLTDEYLSQSDEERERKRLKVAKKLLNLCCLAVAPVVVVAMDDIHHMDPPSASLFASFLDCDNILFVFTATADIPLELANIEEFESEGVHFLQIGETQASFAKFYEHPRLFHFPLTGLPLEFMAPLACQLLDVRGIPSELENILQNNSRGNPGWVESYLVSLLQSGSVYLATMDPTNPQHENLVFPDMALVSRQGRDYIKKYKIPEENFEFVDQFGNFQTLMEEQQKAEYSYKEDAHSTLDKSNSRMMASIVNHPICLLVPDFNVDAADVPHTLTGVIMTAFDNLDPFTHQLVKAASVLGNKCMRSMLIHVMGFPAPRKMAEAIRNVFDARIITCAKHEIKTKNLGTLKPECSCNEGMKIYYGARLPLYAFCNLLQFRTPLHRETAYELLPEDQKKALHGRAVDFLESEAHRCKACGNRPFFKVPAFNAPMHEWLSAYEWKTGPEKEREEKTQANAEEDKTGSEEDLQRCNSSGSLGICLSVINLNECECHLILATVYIHMIEHARAADDKKRLLSFLIEFSAAAVPFGHSTQAVKFLKEAEKLLTELEGPKKIPKKVVKVVEVGDEGEEIVIEEEEEKEDKTWFARGVIKLLQGQALYDLGHYKRSLKALLPALKTFDISIPEFEKKEKKKKSALKGIAEEIISEVRYYVHRFLPCFQQISTFIIPSGDKPLCSAAAECLSLICQIKMAEDDLDLAQFAAIEGLNKAEQTKDNFLALCRAYSNNIEFSMKNGDITRSQDIEGMSKHLCRKMSRQVTTDRALLLAISRLYYVAFNARLLRGDVEAAIRIGYRSLKLSEKMFQSAATKLLVMPLLVQSLLRKGRLPETVDLLQLLLQVAEENADSSATTWYHALCLELILDTGFALEKYQACKIYAEEKMGAISENDDASNAANRRLIISLWLWCLRCERWEEAMSWEDSSNYNIGINSVTSAIASMGLSLDTADKPEDEYKYGFILSSFPNLISGLKYLEGLLLLMTAKLNIKAYTDVPLLHKKIKHVIKSLQRCAISARIAKPRFLHMLAYYNVLRARTARAVGLLQKAASYSKNYGDVIELAWLDHNKRVWLGLSSTMVKDFWRLHCNGQTVDWHEANVIESSSLLFSLPVPRNFL